MTNHFLPWMIIQVRWPANVTQNMFKVCLRQNEKCIIHP